MQDSTSAGTTAACHYPTRPAGFFFKFLPPAACPPVPNRSGGFFLARRRPSPTESQHALPMVGPAAFPSIAARVSSLSGGAHVTTRSRLTRDAGAPAGHAAPAVAAPVLPASRGCAPGDRRPALARQGRAGPGLPAPGHRPREHACV